MRVKVKYMAQLRQVAGVAAEEIDIPSPCTPEALVRQLADARGDSFRRIVLTDHDTIQPALLVFAGEEQIRGAHPHDFRDGELVTILTPMAGG